ncbi:hypothetical protein BH24ACT5_BH24ACT5_27140 [soil metagenome]
MTLVPFAEELRRHDWAVALPDLRDALRAPRPQWRAIVDLVTRGQGRPDIIVGHSGAGVLLPVLAEALDPTFVAFVDAIVPDGDTYEPAAEFVEFIDSLDTDRSMLPPWHHWWGHDVMTDLVPDADLRVKIAADTPQVPRSFYDDAVHLPARWSDRAGCVMLQLSAGYAEFRTRAEAFGWPTGLIDGQHLDVATRPEVVREHLLQLIADADAARLLG